MRVNRLLVAAGIFSLGSALPSDARAQREVRRGWVGIAYTTGVGQSDRNGALVFSDYPVIESIEPGSPAEKAGLQAGDLIISLDAQDLRKNPMPPNLLEPGRKIVFRFRRNDVPRTSTVTVAQRPSGTYERTVLSVIEQEPRRVLRASAAPGQRVRVTVPLLPPAAPAPFVFAPNIGIAGALVTELNDDLRELLELRTQGVFVVNVAQGTPASESGLRSGDVIVIANRGVVRNPGELLSIMDAAEDKRVRLEIIRKKRQQPINLDW